MVSADEQATQLEKLRTDQANKWSDQLDGYLTEGAKASILLNSGAIVATLGFLGALAGKDLGGPFLFFGLTASALFTMGAICSVATFHSRHRQLWVVWIRQEPSYLWTQLTYGLAGLSLACFALGVAFVLFGAASAYAPASKALATGAAAPVAVPDAASAASK